MACQCDEGFGFPHSHLYGYVYEYDRAGVVAVGAGVQDTGWVRLWVDWREVARVLALPSVLERLAVERMDVAWELARCGYCRALPGEAHALVCPTQSVREAQEPSQEPEIEDCPQVDDPPWMDGPR